MLKHQTVIVTIHGILTNVKEPDDWQEKFDKWLHENYHFDFMTGDMVHAPFTLGWINPLRAHFTTVLYALKLDHIPRRWSVDKFKKFLQEVKSKYPNHKIHILAHSFGTWVTHEVLRENPNIVVQSVNLMGGVISAHIKRNSIDEILQRKQAKTCFSWSSHNDKVVRPIAIPPFGHLGYWGFLRPDVDTDRVNPMEKPFDSLEIYNHHTGYPHSGYFIPEVFETVMNDIAYSNEVK